MKLSQRDKELGYCEEAQTYCSVAEDRYKLGIKDTVSKFKDMALMVDYSYDYVNLDSEQIQAWTDFFSNEVINVINFIANKIEGEQ